MLNETLRKVATTLERLGVPYVLIGGMAVSARGALRATKDVDFLIDWPLDKCSSLAQVLTKSGLPSAYRKADHDDQVGGVIRMAVEVGSIITQCDLLLPKKIWQTDAIPRASLTDLDGFKVPVAQADDLFLLKLYAGGPVDLMDAAYLYDLQSEKERAAWKKRAARGGEPAGEATHSSVFGE